MRLVSVGNVMVDLVLRVPTVPAAGEDVVAENRGASAGGAFNMLSAAARQGLSTAYAGGHGTGPFGDLVRAALGAEGIEVLQRPTIDADSGYDLAMVDDAGERTFVTAFGAEGSVQSLAALEEGDLLHVSGYGLLASTNARVIVPWLTKVTVFDPGPLVAEIAPTDLDAVRERTEWLSCNEREWAFLKHRGDWRHVVVRLGPEGCLVDGEKVAGFPAEVVDTNGAGDAHVGVFVAGLAAGVSPTRAARRANAAASVVVSRLGPATAPTAAELDALLQR